jgi:hypothetical protein
MEAGDRTAWPATEPAVFAPLLLAACLVPLVAHLAVGGLGSRAAMAWTAAATGIVASLGWFSVTRGALPAWPGQNPAWPHPRLWLALAALLFILHVRVLDCVAERRLLPAYSRHFDTAWKLAVQIALAAAFLGAFWAVLSLAALLFDLLGYHLRRDVLEKLWFAVPASAMAIGLALHVTDVQPALIRGVRSVGLLLLAWLLPLLALLLAAFLAVLATSGLGPLWATGRASQIVLAGCAALVVLLNAAYQDGTVPPPRLLRMALQIGALLVLPLAAMAAWSLSLRVAQHGWTTDRILVAAAALIALTYGTGYAVATLRPALRGLQATNHAAAHLAVAVLVAFHTPVADPARLMVASQLARLESGAVPPDRFDFVALRTDGARWGTEALRRFVARDEPVTTPAAHSALLIQTGTSRTGSHGLPDPLTRFAMHPADAPLPDDMPGLVAVVRSGIGYSPCLDHSGSAPCTIRRIDLGPDEPEAVLVGTGTDLAVLLTRRPRLAWQRAGHIRPLESFCHGRGGWLTQDNIQVTPPLLPDLVANGIRLRIDPAGTGCPAP